MTPEGWIVREQVEVPRLDFPTTQPTITRNTSRDAPGSFPSRFSSLFLRFIVRSRQDLGLSTFRSNSATLTSMSSISIAFAECSSTLWAARTFVAAGVMGSTMTLSSVETAAPVACCNLAMDWE